MKISTLFATLALAVGLLSSGCVNVAPNSGEDTAQTAVDSKSQEARIADLERRLAERDDDKKGCWQRDRIRRHVFWNRKHDKSISEEEAVAGRQEDSKVDSVRFELSSAGWIETDIFEVPFNLSTRIIEICPNSTGTGGKLRYRGYDGDYTTK